MSRPGPSAMALLDTWEAGHLLGPVERALALLMLARPDVAPETLADLPVGRRDAALLALREQLFGPRIVALARCPACDERIEMTFGVADVVLAAGTADDEPSCVVEQDGYAVRARPVTSADLLNTYGLASAKAQERVLLGRCTLDARRGQTPVVVDELPDAVADAVAQALGEVDPQAEMQVALTCPACGHEGHALFDAAAFLWREIDAWAKRTLDEIHTLASIYGWSEREILSMSAARRGRYVSIIAGTE